MLDITIARSRIHSLLRLNTLSPKWNRCTTLSLCLDAQERCNFDIFRAGSDDSSTSGVYHHSIMAHGFARKRSLASSSGTQAAEPHFSSYSPNPDRTRRLRRIRRCIVRRVRLLFALLLTYPYLLALILLSCCFIPFFISIFLRNTINTVPESHSMFLQELTEVPPYSFSESDLLESFDFQQVQNLSKLQQIPDSLVLSATLTNSTKALISISLPPFRVDGMPSSNLPRMHKLASMLQLSGVVAPSLSFLLPAVLDSSIIDRHTARAIVRAAGFRSRLHVPEDVFFRAYAIPVTSDSDVLVSTLDMPAIEPYDWRFRFPSSSECDAENLTLLQNDAHPAEHMRRIRECKQLVEMMLVLYLSGCAPISGYDLLQRGLSEESNLAVLALGRRCFEKDRAHSIVAFSILKQYLTKSRMLPHGVLGRISMLTNMPRNVGERANTLLKLLQEVHRNISQSDIQPQWTFYESNKRR